MYKGVQCTRGFCISLSIGVIHEGHPENREEGVV